MGPMDFMNLANDLIGTQKALAAAIGRIEALEKAGAPVGAYVAEGAGDVAALSATAQEAATAASAIGLPESGLAASLLGMLGGVATAVEKVFTPPTPVNTPAATTAPAVPPVAQPANGG